MNTKRSITAAAFLLGLFLCMGGYSQDKKNDSYKSLKSRSSDQQSIDELLKEAYEIKDSNAGEALNKVREALGMSLIKQDLYSEGRCYALLGDINENIEEWKLALENFTQAYQKLSGAYTHTFEYRDAVRGLGNTNLKLGNHTQALQYFQEALSLKLDSKERSERQIDISEVYYQMGNYKDALNILDEIRMPKISNDGLAVKIQNQKAKIYARTNELVKAQDNIKMNVPRSNKTSVPKKVEAEEELSFKDAKEEISDVLVGQKLYDDEIKLRNQSIEYNTESNNFAEVSKDKVELSKALVAKGETSAAIRELEEATAIADTINNPKEQAKAFLALADLYEKNNRNTQAIQAYKRYSEAVDKTEKQNQTHLLEKSELIKKQKDIEELSKDVTVGQRDETIEKGTVFRQQLTIYGLLTIILIIAVTSYFIYKNALASKVANQLLALKSLRSQMNPHFIFNALNSVNHFIAQQDERTANKFLSEFSQLMRLVMENSQEDFIPLYKEQEILSLYLKLEHYRFRDKFDYEINLDENINVESLMLPPMLIQPYIENAVWHGLRYKESKGYLTLNIRKEGPLLIVEIIDDGIGRKKSAELKTNNQKKHHSTGLKNIQERLTIINKVYKAHYEVLIDDAELPAGIGTRVKIIIPNHANVNGV